MLRLQNIFSSKIFQFGNCKLSFFLYFTIIIIQIYKWNKHLKSKIETFSSENTEWGI